MAYRHYILCLLILAYMHSLVSRLLPAFLASVPTPGCEDVCKLSARVPLCLHEDSWPSVEHLAQDQPCLECRARVGKYAGLSEDGSWYNIRDGACITNFQYGLLMGYGFALPFVLGSFATVRLLFVASCRSLLAGAMLIWSVATGAQAWAESFLPIFLSRALLGGAQAFTLPMAFSIATDNFEKSSHALVSSLLSSSVCLGAGLSSFTMPLSVAYGWRSVAVAVGAVGVILAALLRFTVPKMQHPQETDEAFQGTGCSLQSAVVQILTAAASIRLAAAYTIASFLPVYYTRTELPGYSANLYATANAAIVASTGLVSAVLGGCVADSCSGRFTAAPAVVAGGAQCLAGVLFAGVFFARSFQGSLAFYACALLIGECWLGLALVQIKREVAGSMQNQTVTLFLSVATLCSDVGPAIVGYIDGGTAASLGLILRWLLPICYLASGALFFLGAQKVKASQLANDMGESLCHSRTDAESTIQPRVVRFLTEGNPSERWELDEDTDEGGRVLSRSQTEAWKPRFPRQSLHEQIHHSFKRTYSTSFTAPHAETMVLDFGRCRTGSM